MATNNPNHRRRSIRLKGYDYSSPGAYFITLVTWHREEVLGQVIDCEMILNDIGNLVQDEWLKTGSIRKEIFLDAYILMPNHLHAIVWITEFDDKNRPLVGAHGRAPQLKRQPRSLGSLVAGFKSSATKLVNQQRHTPGHPLWQRNYYDRIIRNETELENIRRYIQANPLNWEKDAENPGNT